MKDVNLSYCLDKGALDVAIPLEQWLGVEADSVVDPDRGEEIGEHPLEVMPLPSNSVSHLCEVAMSLQLKSVPSGSPAIGLI